MGSPTTVAIYRRELEAGLDRVWENVLDWEHLPWLHRTRFSEIRCLGSGPWGWRARVGLQPEGRGGEMTIELLVERSEQRYVTRILEGDTKGTEIWTRLAEVGPQRTDIEVEFRVPGVAGPLVDTLGQAYTTVYRDLWDEDEAMMRRRQRQLDRGRPPVHGTEVCVLGPLAELRRSLPRVVEIDGRSFRIVEHREELIAHSMVCPHRLGPLGEGELSEGSVRCPWHGYRYDLRTGQCHEVPSLRLESAPILWIDPDTQQVTLGWESGDSGRPS